MELASKYDPQAVEAKWYEYWLNNKLFSSKPDGREPYTVVIPPPNVTGVLHMGHMLNNTIQDILVRRARMEGKNACWVPGTDHASIATEAKVVARFAAEFQALDSLRVAEALDKRLQAEGRSLDVFVQVNTSGEPSKFGLSPEDVPAFVQALPGFSALRVRGLMTLALFSSEAERVRQCFILLRSLRDRLRQEAPAGLSFDELSMGMSGDYEIAIEEGATVVRVGQAIFGARALPDSHYWPGVAGTDDKTQG